MSRETATTKPLRRRLGISLATLVLALLVFELICRGLAIDFNPNPVWRFHPTLGWTQEKSMVSERTIDGDRVRIETNAMGFRDIDHTVRKPAGTRRIIVLGDSFSEASQVDIEETYWRHLRSQLNQNGNQRWEVINLGVGDFGNAQAWLALTEFGLDFSPDIVLFQLFPLNDICNNAIELAGLCKSQNDSYRPYFVDTPRGLEITTVQPMRNRLRRWLVTFGVLERAYLTLHQQLQNQSVEELHQTRIRRRGFGGDTLLYTFVDDAEQIAPVANGWRITELILEKTHNLLTERQIPWLPVVMPFEARFGPNWQQFADGYPQMKMVQDYPEIRLGRLFEKLEVPYVFLKPVFEEHLDDVLPTRGGHLYPRAHALAGEAIFEKMMEAGMLD